MKRKGFTLSEILVAMAIIGVIAAITIPMVHRVMPDKDKAIVLKVFKTLNEINDDIINNPTLYRFGDGTDCEHILQCTAKPLGGGNYESSIYSGNGKYPQLLADNLNLSNSSSNVGQTIIVGSGNTFSFTTSDGVDWALTKTNDGYDLVIDTHNPQRNCNGVYGSNCRNPHQFSFEIDNDAVVTGNDPLTRAYLLNPDDLNARNADLKKACELLNQ